MDPHDRVEITDKDGWRKEFPLQKTIIHIGSDSGNDIVLEGWRGGGAASRHLQLISGLGDKQGYRAINLGDAGISMGDRVLSPLSATDIADGERLQVGEFTLVFRLRERGTAAPPAVVSSEDVSVVVDSEDASAKVVGEDTSPVIGLSLSLPQSSLEPEHPIEGSVTVRNLGNRPGVQFKLAMEGLDPEVYEMGPGPILFPNAEKEVFLRLRHPQGPHPPAGEHRIRIRITAPEAYPGQSATVSRDIQILPFYKHTLRLVAPD